MKLYLITAIFAFALFSCTKSMFEDAISNSGNTIESFKAEVDFDTKIQKYNLLSPMEQFTIWKEHLIKAKKYYIKANDTVKANSINQLLSTLPESIFYTTDTTSRDIFLNYTIPTWRQTAELIFSQEEIYDIVFDPTKDNIGGEGGTLTGRAAPPASTVDCFCHVGTSGFSCKKTSFGFPSGITIETGICETQGDCTYSRRGCSWLWLSSCNGSHCSF